MKILTLKQPHAELVLRGKKTIVLRKKSTEFRGQVLIHAAEKPDLAACKAHGIDPKKVTHGAIIGKGHLVAIKEYVSKKGFNSDKGRHLYADFDNSVRYGFIMKNVERLAEPLYSLEGHEFLEG